MFDKTLYAFENIVIAITFASITFISFANVLSRYVLNASLSFTGEVIVNIAALLTLVGASAAVREGSHPGFSLIRDSTSGLLHKLSIIFVTLMMMVFYGAFLWLGMDMVMNQAASGRVTPALAVPQWIFSLALPFGALLGGVRTVQVGVLALKDGETLVSEEELVIEEALEEAGMSETDPIGRKS